MKIFLITVFILAFLDPDQARFRGFVGAVETHTRGFAQVAKARFVEFVAQGASQVVVCARVVEEDVRVFAVGLVAADENRAVGAKNSFGAELRCVLTGDFHDFHAAGHIGRMERGFGDFLEQFLPLRRVGSRDMPTRAAWEMQRATSRAAALQTAHAVKAQRVVIRIVVAQPTVQSSGQMRVVVEIDRLARGRKREMKSHKRNLLKGKTEKPHPARIGDCPPF